MCSSLPASPAAPAPRLPISAPPCTRPSCTPPRLRPPPPLPRQRPRHRGWELPALPVAGVTMRRGTSMAGGWCCPRGWWSGAQSGCCRRLRRQRGSGHGRRGMQRPPWLGLGTRRGTRRVGGSECSRRGVGEAGRRRSGVALGRVGCRARTVPMGVPLEEVGVAAGARRGMGTVSSSRHRPHRQAALPLSRRGRWCRHRRHSSGTRTAMRGHCRSMGSSRATTLHTTTPGLLHIGSRRCHHRASERQGCPHRQGSGQRRQRHRPPQGPWVVGRGGAGRLG